MAVRAVGGEGAPGEPLDEAVDGEAGVECLEGEEEVDGTGMAR